MILNDLLDDLETDIDEPDEQSHHSWPMKPEEYALGQVIGFGSSAIVHLATCKPSNAIVAVKILDLDQCDPSRLENHLEELRREISLMSTSKHPNILKIYTSFLVDQKLWIVTPFISGGSCLDAIRATFKKGFDDEALIATILYQALKGLDYIHKNGCIHRDIKAGNMLVGSNGLVKLADFGVASTLYEGEHRRVRRTFVGTPCWMAPEVMEMNPGGYDCKADIWSLGITAIELATGSAPYAKYPPMKIIYLTLTSPPPSLSCESKKFSKSFRQFVDTCLQKDTVSRPTCEALLRHPFIKTNAKKASYVAEHLYSKIAPIHSRCRKEHVDSQISLKEHEQELSDWNFASDKEGIELKDTLLTTYEPGICSRKRGRFLVSNNVPSEDDSLPTLADKLEALSVTSVHGEGLSQKGRFSLVEEENSLGDSVRNSEQKGRFHVERDGADATLKSPIISMYSHDFQQCASPLSHVDQLLLLNEMVRHQLLDLRNILAVTQDFDARQDVDKPLAGNHRSSLSLSESRP